MPNNEVPADLAIEAFLQAIKDAAAEIPEFRSRLVDALGFTVLFEGAEQYQGANPATQAARWSEDAFKRIWAGATPAELKKVLKDRGLASEDDLKGKKTKPALLTLLYQRALAQAEETGKR
jgi:hypothetical protein